MALGSFFSEGAGPVNLTAGETLKRHIFHLCSAWSVANIADKSPARGKGYSKLQCSGDVQFFEWFESFQFQNCRKVCLVRGESCCKWAFHYTGYLSQEAGTDLLVTFALVACINPAMAFAAWTLHLVLNTEGALGGRCKSQGKEWAKHCSCFTDFSGAEPLRWGQPTTRAFACVSLALSCPGITVHARQLLSDVWPLDFYTASKTFSPLWGISIQKALVYKIQPFCPGTFTSEIHKRSNRRGQERKHCSCCCFYCGNTQALGKGSSSPLLPTEAAAWLAGRTDLPQHPRPAAPQPSRFTGWGYRWKRWTECLWTLFAPTAPPVEFTCAQLSGIVKKSLKLPKL